MENEATQCEIDRLERRLAETLARYSDTAPDPLLYETRHFGEAALAALKQQQKLIRISDLVQADLYEKRLALDRLNEEKTLFFSIIAHDLRNPIYAQLANLDLLEEAEGEVSREERHEIVHSLRESGRRLVALLENLLDWAGVSMNTLPYQPVGVPLREALLAAGHGVAELAGAKRVRLHYPDRAPTALADMRMVNAILRNLLTNAIKFSHPGGDVRLKAWEADDAVYVTVRDEGAGMEPEVRASLFDKTVKTSRGGTGGERGSGVGLILVSELVARHGGHITVESELGHGASFTFSLPRWTGQSATEAAPDHPNASAAS